MNFGTSPVEVLIQPVIDPIPRYESHESKATTPHSALVEFPFGDYDQVTRNGVVSQGTVPTFLRRSTEMRNKLLTFAIATLFSCVFANAQEYRLSYSAYLSKNDLKSSSGAKLTSASAILQQDRANYHKFKKRDKGDTDDGGFFAILKNRSSIPALLKRGEVDKSMLKLIQKGDIHVMVELFSDEDTGLDYIEVSLVE